MRHAAAVLAAIGPDWRPAVAGVGGVLLRRPARSGRRWSCWRRCCCRAGPLVAGLARRPGHGAAGGGRLGAGRGRPRAARGGPGRDRAARGGQAGGGARRRTWRPWRRSPALISVLNARTPGGGAWAILMALLVLVFLIPWLEGAGLRRAPIGLGRLRLDQPVDDLLRVARPGRGDELPAHAVRPGGGLAGVWGSCWNTSG